MPSRLALLLFLRSPVKEVVYAVRAISPLIVALVLLVVVVLRQPLPSTGFVDHEEEGGPEGNGGKQDPRKAGTGDGSCPPGNAHKNRTGDDIEQGPDQVGMRLVANTMSWLCCRSLLGVLYTAEWVCQTHSMGA